MTPREIELQRDIILAAAKQRWPKCLQLRVMQYTEDESRWLVNDPESNLWWEASPGGAARDASGYRRPDTVTFWPVVWRESGRRTREETLAAELGDHGVPEDEAVENDW